jgi:hypothetical protein
LSFAHWGLEGFETMRVSASLWAGVIPILFLSLGRPPLAEAQSALGYLSGGPALVRSLGNRESAWQLGAGGEKLFGSFGAGGGVDYVYFPEVTKVFNMGRVQASSPPLSTAAISVNGSFYPGRSVPNRSARPFIIAGVSYLLDDEAPLPMLHIAAGFDWWASRRAGLRFEVREQFPSMLAFRCGVVFR